MKKTMINLIFSKTLLSICLATGLVLAQAQQSDQWSKGEILLANGAQIEGFMVYATDVELVSVKLNDSTQKTYGSTQLQSFYFLDRRTNLIRHFKKSALPEESREGIVEVVFEGSLQVRRCFKPKYRRYAKHDPVFNFSPTNSYDHNLYQYFVHDGICLRTLEAFSRKDFSLKKKKWKKTIGPIY